MYNDYTTNPFSVPWHTRSTFTFNPEAPPFLQGGVSHPPEPSVELPVQHEKDPVVRSAGSLPGPGNVGSGEPRTQWTHPWTHAHMPLVHEIDYNVIVHTPHTLTRFSGGAAVQYTSDYAQHQTLMPFQQQQLPWKRHNGVRISGLACRFPGSSTHTYFNQANTLMINGIIQGPRHKPRIQEIPYVDNAFQGNHVLGPEMDFSAAGEDSAAPARVLRRSPTPHEGFNIYARAQFPSRGSPFPGLYGARMDDCGYGTYETVTGQFGAAETTNERGFPHIPNMVKKRYKDKNKPKKTKGWTNQAKRHRPAILTESGSGVAISEERGAHDDTGDANGEGTGGDGPGAHGEAGCGNQTGAGSEFSLQTRTIMKR